MFFFANFNSVKAHNTKSLPTTFAMNSVPRTTILGYAPSVAQGKEPFLFSLPRTNTSFDSCSTSTTEIAKDRGSHVSGR